MLGPGWQITWPQTFCLTIGHLLFEVGLAYPFDSEPTVILQQVAYTLSQHVPW